VNDSPARAAAATLREFAMSFPHAYEEFPWGETAIKVKGKVFLFLHAETHVFGLSVKLPQSSTTALDRPFAEPTGYGLGKSGWVSCRFELGDRVPIDELLPWITESYRAVAPKTIVKELDGGATAAPAKKPAAKTAKKTSKSSAKPAAKKRAKAHARKR
jgi:predicted DNA-binding protein (MmcQ/YjbR family)